MQLKRAEELRMAELAVVLIEKKHGNLRVVFEDELQEE